jgi:hypothetical protein
VNIFSHIFPFLTVQELAALRATETQTVQMNGCVFPSWTESVKDEPKANTQFSKLDSRGIETLRQDTYPQTSKGDLPLIRLTLASYEVGIGTLLKAVAASITSVVTNGSSADAAVSCMDGARDTH